MQEYLPEFMLSSGGTPIMAEACRILILEDRPADIELIQFELQEGGLCFEAKVATNREDYIRALAEFSPDLILSDYDLPKYDGLSALAEAKDLCPSVPFILVTGAIVEDRAIEILTRGAKDYVLKNRLEQRLVPAVRRALAEAEEQRARRRAEQELKKAHDELEIKVRERTATLEAKIGELTRTQKALRESEERAKKHAEQLRVTLDAAPAIIWTAHDRDCCGITGNRAAYEFSRVRDGIDLSKTGSVPERLAHYRIFRDGVELEPHEMPLQLVARTGQELRDLEIDFCFDDGSVRTILGNVIPLAADNHAPEGAVGAFMDITERKRAQAEAREHEERFRKYFELGLVGMAITTPAKAMTEFNEKFCEILGYDKSELKTLTWADLTHPDDLTVDVSYFNRVIAGEIDGYSLDKRFIRKDRQIVFTTLSVKCIRTADGAVDYFLAQLQDISERKRAEEELRSRQAALNEAQRLAHIGSWQWDAKTDVTTGSDELLRIYGFDPGMDTMPDFNAQRGRCYPVEDWERVNAAVQRTVETGVGYELDVRAIRNGEPIWITTRGEAVRNAEGRIVGLRGTVQDITVRKQAEERLRQSEELLRAVTDNSPDAIYVKDRESRWLMANPAVLRIVGRSAEQAIGKTDQELYADPAIGSAILENDRRLLEHGEAEAFEEVADTPGGRRTFLSIKAPWRDAQGNIRGIVGISHDITERKAAEEFSPVGPMREQHPKIGKPG